MPERGAPVLPTVDAVDDLAPEQLPSFVAQLGALAMRAAARMAVNHQSSQTPSPALDNDQLLTAAQAATLLSVPEGYVGDLGRRGELPRVPFGKYVRFRLGDLRAWINRHHQPGVDCRHRRNV
jgi:excisionase family DNA binding protein